jgi:hypothetical protein
MVRNEITRQGMENDEKIKDGRLRYYEHLTNAG